MKRSSDPYHLVWESLEPFEIRAERVASELEAIAQTVQDMGSTDPAVQMAQSAFADHWAFVCTLDPEPFTRLISSAYAYAATRRIDGCVKAWIGAEDPGEDTIDAYVDALGSAALLAVSAAIIGGRSLALGGPLDLPLPHHLPATDLIVAGEGALTIQAFDGETIVGSQSAQSAQSGNPVQCPLPSYEPADLAHAHEGAARLVRSPSFNFGEHQVLLSPHFFDYSQIPSEHRQQCLKLGLEGHQAWTGLAERTVEVIERYAPVSFTQMAATLEAVGISDPDVSGSSQATLSDLPGSFITTGYPHPHLNVEAWVHEHFHTRLFVLEELGPIFVSEELEQGGGPEIYSPWRISPRPLKGLLHSVYVFVPVAEFCLALYQDDTLGEIDKAYALDETLRHTLQLRIGLHLMQSRIGDFTEWGQVVLEQLARAIEQQVAACERLGLPTDAPAMIATRAGGGPIQPLTWKDRTEVISVRENVRANMQRGDHLGDCRNLPFAV